MHMHFNDYYTVLGSLMEENEFRIMYNTLAAYNNNFSIQRAKITLICIIADLKA